MKEPRRQFFREIDGVNEIRGLSCFVHLMPEVKIWDHLSSADIEDPADFLGLLPSGRTVAIEVKGRENWRMFRMGEVDKLIDGQWRRLRRYKVRDEVGNQWETAPHYPISKNKIEKLWVRADYAYLIVLPPMGPTWGFRILYEETFPEHWGGRPPRPGAPNDQELMFELPLGRLVELPEPCEKKVEKTLALVREP